jgi:hypothetical protein
MQRGLFRSAVILVSCLTMGSLLYVVTAQIKSGVPAKSGVTDNSAGTAKTAATAAKSGEVRVWEEKVTIPTYLLGEPEPNPQFYFGGASQGAQHRIYPYPAYDNLTTEKKDKTYTMVYMENEYVKIGILPEIGGKIFEAVDKTNGYDFIYNQHVIKPALISLLGAWISGGIEWDLPAHAVQGGGERRRIEDSMDRRTGVARPHGVDGGRDTASGEVHIAGIVPHDE